MNKVFKFFNLKFLPIILLLITTYCAYYNTFFNAEENYRVGMEKKNNSPSDENKISKEIQNNFESAISKSWAVIEIYGDSNSWADDALLLIGKSHYQLGEYKKSQETLEQFLQKYLKSPLRSDAELWLAQTFVAQGKVDDALNSFTKLISTSTDDDLLAEAYFNIAEIYFNSKDYDLAIDNFHKCIDLTSSSETAGNAQYKLADAYYNEKNYEDAVVNYKEVLQYDLPIIKQYDAVIQMSNSLIKLRKFDDVQEMLLNIMQDQRFKDHYSMIATKLANMIEFKGDKEFALDKYYEVIEDYPKTEGAALASFYIAQIYEFEYGLLDSAKIKYENVKKIYAKSQSIEEANERAGILTTYLNIRNDLRKDKEDIYKLEHGDSSLVDSLEIKTKADSIQFVQEEVMSGEKENQFPEEGQQLQADENNQPADSLSSFPGLPQRDPRATAIARSQQTGNPTVKKKAVPRKPEEVEKSLLKNSFNIAEFFLLTYQHSDSAKAAYINFVNNFEDSLLTPKAYYSLYYIYNDLEQDSLDADSVKQIILSRYPETIYGEKLSGKDVEVVQKVNLEIKNKFLKAESLVDDKKYDEAIELYNQVAQLDSGSIWAQKSRYATAYIYENYLSDKNKAIASYSRLAKEYPESEPGKIASYKIAEPKVEIVVPDSSLISNQNVVSDSSLINNQIFEPDTSGVLQENLPEIETTDEAKGEDGQ
jgi:TolA-binding protein